jgi:hypothetical protein
MTGSEAIQKPRTERSCRLAGRRVTALAGAAQTPLRRKKRQLQRRLRLRSRQLRQSPAFHCSETSRNATVRTAAAEEWLLNKKAESDRLEAPFPTVSEKSECQPIRQTGTRALRCPRRISIRSRSASGPITIEQAVPFWRSILRLRRVLLLALFAGSPGRHR